MFPRLFLEVGGCSGRKSMNAIPRGQSTHCSYVVRSKGASQVWISWPGDIRWFDFVQRQLTTASGKHVQHNHTITSWRYDVCLGNPRLNKSWLKTVPATEKSLLWKSSREGLRRVIAHGKAPPRETCRYQDTRDNLPCVISLLELLLSYMEVGNCVSPFCTSQGNAKPKWQ